MTEHEHDFVVAEHDIPWYARYPHLKEYDAPATCAECGAEEYVTIDPKEFF